MFYSNQKKLEVQNIVLTTMCAISSDLIFIVSNVSSRGKGILDTCNYAKKMQTLLIFIALFNDMKDYSFKTSQIFKQCFGILIMKVLSIT